MFRAFMVTLMLIAFPAIAVAGEVEDTNKALCQKFYEEVVNQGNFDLIDEMMAENFVEHEVFPGLSSGREGVKEFFMMMRNAFPDFHMKPEFSLAEGDKVVTYLTMSGTHKGEFMGMPASGKKFSTTTIDIVRMADGKAVEHWGVTDAMKMMHQLGMVPEGGHEGHGHEGHDHK